MPKRDVAGDRLHTGEDPAVKIFDQRQQLGDVVAMPTGQADRQRDAAGVDQQMVL
jgi:hypothetical protein